MSITQGSEAFDLAEWPELAAAETHRSIFSTIEWNRLWWAEFGQAKTLAVLTFLDPEPVGLAALMLDETPHGRRIRFLGGDDLTDYLGPLSRDPSITPKIADAMINLLKNDPPFAWDWFDAKCLPVPFGFAEWLVEAADRHSMSFEIHEEELSAVLALPGTFEEYLAALNKKNRHELRRKMRRFDQEIPGSRLVRATQGSLHEDLLRFVNMHRGSEGLKGKFFLPERAFFFARLADSFMPKGWLSLDFLEGEDATIASTFSFTFDGVFYLYNSAYDPRFRSASPGLVLVAKLIERSIEEGLHTFDFLRGRERYKTDLGGEPLPLYSVSIRNDRAAPSARND
ncbi:MAG: GNAT family N-acetyltransferase [Actinobacteria bacterium]|nr:GNAT family N-acetyltransferase [Actinomycetota bacterium]